MLSNFVFQVQKAVGLILNLLIVVDTRAMQKNGGPVVWIGQIKVYLSFTNNNVDQCSKAALYFETKTFYTHLILAANMIRIWVSMVKIYWTHYQQIH